MYNKWEFKMKNKKDKGIKQNNPFEKKENDSIELSEADMRLNRYLAHSGVASRRASDEIIKSGRVKVNGNIVLEMGYRVKDSDLVELDGKPIEPIRSFSYYLMNKPYNVITTLSDEKGRRTVLDIIKEHTNERVFPVGRLDRNTTGLLILTNDGDLAQKLSHPKFEVIKVYRVVLDKDISTTDLEKIRNTIELEDGPAPVDEIKFLVEGRNNIVGVQIHIGRNRIVRRIFEHLGYEVKQLDRTRYAMLTKKNLTTGMCRKLTIDEINILKYMMKSPTKDFLSDK